MKYIIIVQKANIKRDCLFYKGPCTWCKHCKTLSFILSMPSTVSSIPMLIYIMLFDLVRNFTCTQCTRECYRESVQLPLSFYQYDLFLLRRLIEPGRQRSTNTRSPLASHGSVKYRSSINKLYNYVAHISVYGLDKVKIRFRTIDKHLSI